MEFITDRENAVPEKPYQHALSGELVDNPLSALEPELDSKAADTVHVHHLTLDAWHLAEKQTPTVTKSNLLIRALSTFTKNQQKVLAAAISKINPWTAINAKRKELAEHQGTSLESQQIAFRVRLTANDLAESIGVDQSNLRKFIDKATDAFHSTPIQMVSRDSRGTRVTKFNVATSSTFHWEDNVFEIVFNPMLTKELADFMGSFTSYRLSYYAALPSKYSLQLYELFHSMAFRGGGTLLLFDKNDLESSLFFILGLVTLDKDANILERSSLTRDYNVFRNRVISPSLDAINSATDLKVSVIKEERRGRKVFALRFSVEKSGNVSELVAPAKDLGVSEDLLMYLVSKYDKERVRDNMTLMREAKLAGRIIRNPNAYLSTLVKRGYASLPEKINPISPPNAGSQFLREFLDHIVIAIYPKLNELAQEDIAEHGVESIYLKLTFLDYEAARQNRTQRESLALFSKRELVEKINSMDA